MITCKAIVFDLFNTLVEIPNPDRPMVQLMHRLNLSNADFRRAKKTLMQQNFDNLAAMAKFLSPSAEGNYDELEEILKSETERIRLYPETIDTLEKLQAKGYPIYLLSNLATPYKACVKQLGLEPYFDHIFFSCDIGKLKPDSDLYQLVSDTINIPKEEILMVGDSLKSDYRGGINAGLQAVLVDRIGKRTGELAVGNLKELLSLLD